LALTIAVCAVEVTPESGVGAFATTVEGKVPATSVEMIEPEPLVSGTFTDVVATLAVVAPAAVAFPRTSATENAPEIVADVLTAAPGATVATAITRQTLSSLGSTEEPTNRAPEKLKSAAFKVLQSIGSFAVKTKVSVRVVELADSATKETTCGGVLSGTATVTVRLAPAVTVVLAFWATSVTENPPEIARLTGPVVPWDAVAVAEMAHTVGLSWVTTKLFMPVNVKSAEVTVVQSIPSLPVSLN
jgi:hypothetical protein